ncbi:MAG: hypothetical protein HP477_13580 [Nitrospira sp.]|nr:hypothetical protein [Nitrospira sp.]
MKRLVGLLLLLVGLTLVGCNRSDPIVVIQLHPKNPDIIYVATNDYIYKTRDGGQTWGNLSRGMSYSRVIAMAIDPAYPATVYAGTKGDAVYKSHDGGQRWMSMRAGLDDVTITSVVNQFLFDPADSQHIFLAATMGVFETKNGGEQWTKRMEGMKEVLMVVTIGMDPNRSAVLYAGTSGGVYKSVDGAGHWEKVNNGLVPPQEIGVTPMQMVSAVAAIANGGVLMRPYVVSEIRDAQGQTLKEVLPHVRRRVISPETARTVTAILEGVVTDGTGGKAAIAGFRVAGKTGTAQKIDPRTGRYSASQFVSSFVGYVPANNPRLAMIVVIDEPRGESWGGTVAAPVFNRVGEQVLNYLGVSSNVPVKLAMASDGIGKTGIDF